ncbi:hypothetical protein [Luteolibacter marinus]|uniref:hypothetical protein n=1 Tax=Luteolibacter marinus TaxID=2776705 RepID=UPI0018665056|nr:hypothetical protein [Luteolibacter marinus]
MSLRLILLSCSAMFLAVSCTPYVEPPPEAPLDPAQRKMTEAEQKEKIREEREAMKKEQEGDGLAEKKKTPEGDEIAKKDDGGGATPEKKTSPVDNKNEPPVARPVPGKPGMVFSPFNNKVIDVKGIPTGRLVADPTYPASEKKHFRVP